MPDKNSVPYYETFDLAQDFLRDPPDADPVTWQAVLGQTRRPNGAPEAEIALWEYEEIS